MSRLSRLDSSSSSDDGDDVLEETLTALHQAHTALSLSLHFAALSLCLHSATHSTNAWQGHSRAAQQRTAAAA
jgi:hypothetical protein